MLSERNAPAPYAMHKHYYPIKYWGKDSFAPRKPICWSPLKRDWKLLHLYQSSISNMWCQVTVEETQLRRARRLSQGDQSGEYLEQFVW